MSGQSSSQSSSIKSANTEHGDAHGHVGVSKQGVLIAAPAPADVDEDPLPSVSLDELAGAGNGVMFWSSTAADLGRLVTAQDEDIEELLLAVSDPSTDLSSDSVMSMLADNPVAPRSL